jgi:hypothetical protein
MYFFAKIIKEIYISSVVKACHLLGSSLGTCSFYEYFHFFLSSLNIWGLLSAFPPRISHVEMVKTVRDGWMDSKDCLRSEDLKGKIAVALLIKNACAY